MTTLEELEQKVKENPYTREFYQLALEYQKLGKIVEAKSVLQKGLERNQGNFNARLLLSKIFIAEGKFNEAKQQVERVLIVVRDNVDANHLAAEISEALGDKESALRYYKVVELFEPERPNVKEKIAQLEQNEEVVEKESNREKELESQQLDITEKETKEENIKEIGDSISENKENSEQKIEEEQNIFQEEEKVEESNLEEEFKEQTFATEKSEELSQEEVKETFEQSKNDEVNLLSHYEDVNNESLVEEEKNSEEIGEDTLTELLNESSFEEKSEIENVEQEEEKINSSFNEKEMETVIQGKEDESLIDEKEEFSSISTATLAELYEKQGYPEKAIEIYEHLLLKEPERDDIRNQIERLKKEMIGLTTSSTDDVGVIDVKSALRGKRIEALKTWLKRIREADNV